MIIDGKSLAQAILRQLAQDIKQGVARGKHPPKLVVFTVAPTSESIAYINSKRSRMEEIGGVCEVMHYTKAPRFEHLVGKLSKIAQMPETSGVIVQLPLPAGLGTISLLDYIPDQKEVEGFKKKSQYASPLGLAVLTMLRSVYTPIDLDKPETVIVDIHKDVDYFRTTMRRKKIVVLGHGLTGGQPLGEVLSRLKISYININENTPTPEEYINQADIIISCVGKTVVHAEHIKQGSILVSVGLHRENGKWVGDYDESQVASKALAYSPTPGGVGPLNVAYLLSNTVMAWEMQE